MNGKVCVMSKNKTMYMCVTRDKYELPIAFADTAVGLSRMLSYSDNAVSNAMSWAKKQKSKCRYIKVEYTDEEEIET